MTNTGDTPQASAYGLACEACVKAKCKCVQSAAEAGGRCERCDRLGKICQPSTSKRQLKPPAVRDSRVEKTRTEDVLRLERKLDHLVAHLKAPEHGFASPTNSDASHLASSTLSFISLTEANENFIRFRNCNLRFFPFFSLPRTAQELQRDRPFLWQCIMAVASKEMSKQRERISRVQEVLSSRITGTVETSIDLLLGLLCYIQWAHFQGKHPVTIRSTLTVFSQLAVAIVFDLGLNKPVAKEPPQLTCIPPPHLRPPQRPSRTMEERRAVLGTYVSVSTLSSALRKVDPMRWTSHMQECLNELEAQGNDPMDEILVQCVKVQLIAEKAMHLQSYDANIELEASLHPPPHIFAQEMLSQLNQLRSSMSDTVSHNATANLSFYAAQIATSEAALCGDPTTTIYAGIQRTKFLYTCTQAINQWYETCFAIPVADMNGITTLTMMQMRHAIGLLYVISTIDEPGWSKADMAGIINLYPILDRMGDHLSQIPAAIGVLRGVDAPNYEDHWWTHVAGTIRTLRSIWSGQSQMMNDSAPGPASVTAGKGVNFGDGLEFDFPGLDWLIDPAMMAYTV